MEARHPGHNAFGGGPLPGFSEQKAGRQDVGVLRGMMVVGLRGWVSVDPTMMEDAEATAEEDVGWTECVVLALMVTFSALMSKSGKAMSK